MKKFLLLLLLISILIKTYSSESYINGVFITPVSRYFDMDIEANNKDFPIEEMFIDNIIEIISGMIYGWNFTYIPSDYKREIDESFTLSPIALIKKGDPAMSFRSNRVKNYIMYQNIVFRLQKFQIERLRSWKSTINKTSTGEGTESTLLENGQSLSLTNALKDSIKKEFQSRGKDKPRKIEGQMLLNEIPRQFIGPGTFTSQVNVILIYKEIDDYKYH